MNSDFQGLPTRTLENQHLRLDFLAEAGPRIVRLFVQGSEQNLLAEAPDAKRETPYGTFYFRGGHRLWHAPEAFPRTYIPDEEGLQVEEVPGGVRLVRSEPITNIRKSVEIRLHEERPAVTLLHELQNEGLWPVTLSPWALTQTRLGGLAILPQQREPVDPHSLLPNRSLALWPYGSVQDDRLILGDDYMLVRAIGRMPPCKVGYLNPHGWLAYLLDGVLFHKEFDTPQSGEQYPDLNSSVEVYCGDEFIELETLGPLQQLEPGQSLSHREVWSLYTDVGDVAADVEGVRRLVERLNL